MNTVGKNDSPSVMFAVTEDWYFWSHRRPLAAYLQSRGCKISLATRFNRRKQDCVEMSITAIDISFERSLRYPFRDVMAMIGLYRAVRELQPDIVHLVSHKPIVLGALSLFACPKTKFIAAFTGMGYLFSSEDRKAHWFQRLMVIVLRQILRRPNVSILVQNEQDRQLLAEERIGSVARSIVIPGVGVDTSMFYESEPKFSDRPLVILAARLIRDKGILEFVSAAREVHKRGIICRFALVGALDPDSPAAISRSEIDKWLSEGVVECWGHREDMPAVYRAANIVCLPSYREGFPKVLLEAAACGRAIVASDVSGCREICQNGVNGTLVKVRDSNSLANAIIELLSSPERQRQYGLAGSQIVKRNYSVERIGEQTLELYRSVLDI